MVNTGRLWAFCCQALGVGTFFFLNYVLGPWAEQIGQTCQTVSKTPQFEMGIFPGSENKAIQGVNFFLCIILHFFKDALSKPSGFALNLMFLPTLSSLLGLMHIEAARKRGWLIWPGIVVLLGQLVGISVTFPMLWVAQYVLGSSSATPDASWIIRRGKLNAAFFGIFWLFLIPTLGLLFNTEKNAWLFQAKLFQIAPALPAVLTLCVPSFGESEKASEAAIKRKQMSIVSSVMLILGGVGAATHIVGIVQIAQNPQILYDMRNAMFSPDGSARTEFFLWLDFAVVLLSLIIFIAWETGSVDEVLKFATMSIWFSPSVALAWFVVDREENLLDRLKLSPPGDKKRQ
eukprot:TRINITY_DN1447_c0_g1_i1.p1 TRINITY_DN1447_c0_g1~~TRINITY_DN1447_c0_g1_i1.p1  ORF type:complete len:346 (+),score=102.23 TRINITY_DN1447_c0_g1_i1:27-1064(+)